MKVIIRTGSSPAAVPHALERISEVLASLHDSLRGQNCCLSDSCAPRLGIVVRWSMAAKRGSVSHRVAIAACCWRRRSGRSPRKAGSMEMCDQSEPQCRTAAQSCTCASHGQAVVLEEASTLDAGVPVLGAVPVAAAAEEGGISGGEAVMRPPRAAALEW